ncbi:hypothetical protein DER46DRAFT_614063 [Fusarium sp. MPI-SDFR-AT-0072]|nr:hypothetical protein DER46DRAFT_614063 [Fusarium sp. MPI-SDFR-AT-0072]
MNMRRDSNPPSKLENSQLFPLSRFPPEIRCIIWGFTLPERQVHKAIIRPRCDSNISTNSVHVISPPLPAALWICRESRASARLTLTRFPRCQCDPNTTALGYFNPKSDILYIEASHQRDDWYAPWVEFTNLCMTVMCEFVFQKYIYPAVSKMISCRPDITLYLAYLYLDEEMEANCCRHMLCHPPMDFIRHTDCVPLQNLRLGCSRPSRYKTLRKLSDRIVRGEKSDCPLTVEIAEVKMCCCYPRPQPSSMKDRY